MKIRNLFLTIFAATAVLFSCKPEPEPEPSLPVLNVGQSELSFEQTGGTASLSVTSNRPWSISTDADWLAFSPSNGGASDSPVSVTVTALANSSTDRTASFKVKTDFDFKTVNVSQKGQKGEDPNKTPMGKGTAEDPYNVAAALQRAQALVAYNNGDELGTENSATVYTKGKVVSVEIDPSYGNASYFISADGTAETQLEVYRGKYFNGDNFIMTDQLKVGDEVVVHGTLVNFKGSTPEYTAGSKIISINGKTEPDKIDFTKFELITVKEFITKADKAQYYRLKGKVSKFNKSYCSFDITDDSGAIYVYSVNNKEEWVDKIKNGGTVELAGLYTFYEKNSQHEVVSAQIISFEEGQEEDYNAAEPKTVAEFISAANKTTYFKLTGKVSNFNSQYCSFDLTDDSGTIYVYSVDNKADWKDKISNNGTVTLAGKYEFYEAKSQHEVVNAQILSFEEGSQEDHSNAEPKTVAEFISAADKTTFYKLTGTVSGFNSQYCSFDLTDESGKIYVYSVDNKAEWKDKLSNDGTVTLAGQYDFYEAKSQHEVVHAQILSFEEGTPVEGDEATVAEAIAAEINTVLKVGPALVVASASTGFLMEQDGAMIYVYKGAAEVGDNVTVNGKRAEYGGAPQLTDPEVTVNSKGNAVTYSDAKDINSTFDTYTSDAREYVTFTGTLNISGNYYNVTVDGATAVTGSIIKPNEDLSALNGKTVTVTGYYLYHTSQGKYLNVIATKVEGEGGVDPGPGDDTKDATVAEAIAAEKDAKLNVGPGLVVASADAGFLLEQDGARIYVYGGKAKVGDNVTVKGVRGEYGGAPQITGPEVKVNSTGATVTYPEAKDINSTFSTYSSSAPEFVTFKGKLSISNNKYFNITVDGSTTVTGSIVKPVEDISSFNDQEVTVKGYYLYHASQGKYLYVIATDINGTAISGEGGDEPGGGGEVSGNSETVDFSAKGYSNAEDISSYKGQNFSISFDKGSNKNGPKYYTSGTAVRVYGANSFTISSSKTITSIKFTFSSGEGTNEITADKGSFSTDTWTGSANSVKFTVGGSTGHRRIKMISVSFAE